MPHQGGGETQPGEPAVPDSCVCLFISQRHWEGKLGPSCGKANGLSASSGGKVWGIKPPFLKLSQTIPLLRALSRPGDV